MITSIKEINDAMRQRCKAADLAFQCGADGALNAEVAIVSEAPGEREASMNMPLVGGAGQALWNALRRYKLTRTQCYVTNVIKRQINFVSGKAQIGDAEKQHWQQLLRWELLQLPNVRYVLILGNPALEALTGETGVTNWRGSVMPVELKHVQTFVDKLPEVQKKTMTGVITYNPALVMREPKLEAVFRMDLHKLERVRNGTFKKHEITAHINPTPSQAIEFMHEMRTGKLPVAFDIEIMGGETACVGFANNPHEGMCVNFRDERSNRWSVEDELLVRQNMQQLFIDDEAQFVAQNGMFDITWLWFKDRIKVSRVWFDTMLAHHTLYSQLPHNLGFLTAQYTDHPYYKDDGKTWREGGNINQYWEYNVKDVCITKQAQQRMENELHQFGQDKFFFDHVMRLQPHLARMTVGGLLVDAPYKQKLTEDLTAEVARLREQFNELARQATRQPHIDVNPNSPKQLSDLFFRKLRLVGRGTSTDAANRKRMQDHPSTSKTAKQMLTVLDQYAKESKFLGTYADMTIDHDGRVRCEYRQTGVQSAPGRLSSSQVMWGSGGNLQNWPERAHHMVLSDDEYVLLYFDLAQAEARVVGWLANIEKWIEDFERARIDGIFDCHRSLASDMFGIAYDEVPTFDRDSVTGEVSLRFIAKRCRHGLNYRMQAARLADTTGLPLERAREAYNLYHIASPELQVWWRSLEDEIRKNRQLVSPKGRVLRIMERITDEALEAMVAFKPQSTIGDHVCEVIYRSESDEEWPTHARMCLNIHDALIALVRKDQVHQAAKVMKKHAESPIEINGRPLIIPADFAVSVPDESGKHRWSTLRKVKHLDDLTKVMRGD